ncbi:MAG: sulfatase [Phycisphaerae bacterium]
MGRPNVVLIMSDQHRFDFMGYESNGTTFTPSLDALGRQGTIFRNAYCNSPLCSPSRICFAAGRYGMNCGAFSNLHEPPWHMPSFVSQLRAGGYRTCAIGKTHMEIHAYNSDLNSFRHREFMDSLGWDEIRESAGNALITVGIQDSYSRWLQDIGMFDKVADFMCQWGVPNVPRKNPTHSFKAVEWPFPTEIQETAFYGRHAVEWINAWEGKQPFFLHVGFLAPHSPIHENKDDLALYRDVPEPEPWGNPAPQPWLADGRRGYRAMITHVDRWVGKIVEALKAKGLLDNTLVIYTSDHGEMAGDFGRFDKGVFYEGSIRIPMIVAGPGVRAGQDSKALVELLDLGRTICDWCGVPAHRLDQGKSLVPVLRDGAAAHRDTIYAEYICDKMLFDGRYKLMFGDPATDKRNFGGPQHTHKPAFAPPNRWRLFDMANDPHELHDLSDDPQYLPLAAEMMRKLLVRITENTQPLPSKDRGTPRPMHPETVRT